MKGVNILPATFKIIIIVSVLLSCRNRNHTSAKTETDSSFFSQDDTSTKFLDLKAVTGKLKLTYTSQQNNQPFDFWIYINEVLKFKSNTASSNGTGMIETNLLPGKYSIEIAVENMPSSGLMFCFPFEFTTQEVEIKGGESTEVNLPVAASVSNCTFLYNNSIDYNDRNWYPAALQKIDDISQQWRFRPIASELYTTYVALESNPPHSNKIFINLPVEYGGGREFEANQVRLLIEFIKHDLWDWLGPGPLYEDDLEKYSQVEKLIKSIRSSTLGVGMLEDIAVKLDKVENTEW